MNSKGFIKLPNHICSVSGLSCRAYLYLTYLCTIQKSDTVKVKQETIRQNIGASFITAVNQTVHKLQKMKLISIINNFNSETGSYICSSYKVNEFNPQKDYFLLPADYAVIDMPPIAYQLMLTLYMYSFGDPYSFPSYTEISGITGMSSASISKAIKILEEKGIVKKENYIKKDGSKGHNRYFLIKKLQRIIHSDKAAKLIDWIGKQKQVCFEVWQIIKETIRGNAPLLDEICSLTDNSENGNDKNSSDNDSEKFTGKIEESSGLYTVSEGLIACRCSDIDYIWELFKPPKHSFFGKIRDKMGCIGIKIKEGLRSLFYNIKRYFS